MKTLRFFNLFLLIPLSAGLIGCSGPLPKSSSLLEAESVYAQAKSDPAILEYASPELKSVEGKLAAAALAESEDDMDTLAYIAKIEVQTAEQITEAAQASKRFDELSREKQALINQSLERQNIELEKQLNELKTKETDRGLLYSLGDVLFVYGKADLQPGATKPLNQLAEYMRRYPEKTMLIEGHTDSTGSAAFNKKLSIERAEFVKQALIQRGVAADRMLAIGLGQSQPIATNATEEGRQKNRRVEVIIQD